MKKFGPITLMIFVAAAIVAPLSCKKPVPEGRLILSGFLGDVTMKTAEGNSIPAVGDALTVGSTLVTGDMAMADILMDDRGIIRIHQNSMVLIDSLDEKGVNDTEINLSSGKIYVTLSKLSKGGLTIQTPTAVASVRGTVFSVSAEEGVSRLDVVSGQVAINPVSESTVISQVEQVVEAEQTVSIDRDAVQKALQAVEKKEEMKLMVETLKEEEMTRITAELRNIKPEIIEKLNPKAREDVRRKIFGKDAGSEIPKLDQDEMKKAVEEKKDALRREARIRQEQLKKSAEKMKREGRERAEHEAKVLIEKQRMEKERAEKELKEKIEKERKEKEVRERASNIPTL